MEQQEKKVEERKVGEHTIKVIYTGEKSLEECLFQYFRRKR